MIVYNPSLKLKRLIVKKGSHTAYDEVFHDGVNVIVGENNSGKSTIIEALIYLLDGEIKEKKEAFDTCDVVYGEFLINEKTHTIKRIVDEDGMTPPIEICSMNYDKAILQENEWIKYTHRRTASRKSFSMAIFSLLGFPEEKTEKDGNITINDVLRLIYQDQKTPADKIFREQDFQESGIKRQAISDFLLGIDDYEIMNLKQCLNKELSKYNLLEGEYNEIYRTLGSADFETNSKTLAEQKKNIEEEVISINDTIQKLAENKTIVEKEKYKLEDYSNEIIEIKNLISTNIEKYNSIRYELNDYREFLTSINWRIDNLFIAQKTSDFYKMDFGFCPQCFRKIDVSSIDNSKTCSLCKHELDSNYVKQNYLKMSNELEFQKKEIEEIINKKEDKLKELEIFISKYQSKLFIEEQKRKDFVCSISIVDANFKTLFRRLGYLDKSLLEIEELKKLALKIDAIKNKKAEMAEKITQLQEKIKNSETSREIKKQKVYSTIETLTLKLIKEDKSDELQNTSLWFDFGTNKLLSETKKSLAASTGTYLKNAFFFSMFLASLEIESIRYPRFIILDNIDDSGLDKPRAQKFHNTIIEYSKNTNISHQIIFTTRSEIASDEIKKSSLLIGKEYENIKGKRSFNIVMP